MTRATMTILTDSDVQRIVERLRGTEPMQKIASDFGVTNGNISSINTGRVWRGVTEGLVEDYPIRIRSDLPSRADYLDVETVEEIVKLLQNSEISQTEIAAAYDTSSMTVSNINTGRSYRAYTEKLVDTYPIRIRKHRRATAKLTADDVRAIIDRLQGDDASMSEIASDFGVTSPTISCINTGRTWTSVSENVVDSFPIRNDRRGRRGLSQRTIRQIVRQLQDTETPVSEIAQEFDVTAATIYTLNKGKRHTEFVETLVDSFPVRTTQTNNTPLEATDVAAIVDRLQDDMTYRDIATEFDVSRQTILHINHGRTWQEVTSELTDTYPIRSRGMSEETVRRIARDIIETDETFYDIAQEHSVCAGTVSSLNRGVTHRETLEEMLGPVRFPLRGHGYDNLPETKVRAVVDALSTQKTYVEISEEHDLPVPLIAHINHGRRYAEFIDTDEFPLRARAGTKLSVTDVERMVRMLKKGCTNEEVATEFDVSVSMVHNVNHGHTWDSVTSRHVDHYPVK